MSPLLKQEKKPPYSGLFEAHITVQPLNLIQSEQFNHLSRQLGVKAIQIQLSRGNQMVQPMTCSTHKGTFQNIYKEVYQLAEQLKLAGFEVSRLKIEAHPNNDGVPTNAMDALLHSDKNYFEYHLKVLLQQGDDLNELIQVCEKHQAHLSSNAFHKMQNGFYENFITTRTYHAGKEEAQIHFNQLLNDMKQLQIPILKQFMEYCIFDTNIDLDKNWLSQDSPCMNCSEPCMKNESD